MLVYMLLIAFLVVVLQDNNQSRSSALPNPQWECIRQFAGDLEVVWERSLDIDQDNKLDRVVLYGRDNLHILVVLNQSPAPCKVIVSGDLTDLALYHPTEWRTVQVHAVEMIELTGDDRPELYIWLDKLGGGPRYSYAVHIVYTLIDGHWQKALHDELCLSFHAFEFRDSPDTGAKDVYLESDPQCKPPWSSSRAYWIRKWNGSEFILSESGTVDVQSTNPPWVNVCWALPVVCTGMTLALVRALLAMSKLRGKRKDSACG